MTTRRTALPSDPCLHLTVPMPLNIANGSHGHWTKTYRAKTEYWRTLDGRQNAGLIPAPPAAPFAKAMLRSVMHLGSAMDDDNAMRRHKWVNDWLKTRGYIADDTRSCLRWEAFPEQIVSRNGERKIELTLTDISAVAAPRESRGRQ